MPTTSSVGNLTRDSVLDTFDSHLETTLCYLRNQATATLIHLRNHPNLRRPDVLGSFQKALLASGIALACAQESARSDMDRLGEPQKLLSLRLRYLRDEENDMVTACVGFALFPFRSTVGKVKAVVLDQDLKVRQTVQLGEMRPPGSPVMDFIRERIKRTPYDPGKTIFDDEHIATQLPFTKEDILPAQLDLNCQTDALVKNGACEVGIVWARNHHCESYLVDEITEKSKRGEEIIILDLASGTSGVIFAVMQELIQSGNQHLIRNVIYIGIDVDEKSVECANVRFKDSGLSNLCSIQADLFKPSEWIPKMRALLGTKALTHLLETGLHEYLGRLFTAEQHRRILRDLAEHGFMQDGTKSHSYAFSIYQAWEQADVLHHAAQKAGKSLVETVLESPTTARMLHTFSHLASPGMREITAQWGLRQQTPSSFESSFDAKSANRSAVLTANALGTRMLRIHGEFPVHFDGGIREVTNALGEAVGLYVREVIFHADD